MQNVLWIIIKKVVLMYLRPSCAWNFDMKIIIKKRKQVMNMQVIAWRAGNIVDDHGQ